MLLVASCERSLGLTARQLAQTHAWSGVSASSSAPSGPGGVWSAGFKQIARRVQQAGVLTEPDCQAHTALARADGALLQMHAWCKRHMDNLSMQYAAWESEIAWAVITWMQVSSLLWGSYCSSITKAAALSLWQAQRQNWAASVSYEGTAECQSLNRAYQASESSTEQQHRQDQHSQVCPNA